MELSWGALLALRPSLLALSPFPGSLLGGRVGVGVGSGPGFQEGVGKGQGRGRQPVRVGGGWRSLLSQPPCELADICSESRDEVPKLSLPVWDERQQ